jgi:RNA-directed DNA polymerase
MSKRLELPQAMQSEALQGSRSEEAFTAGNETDGSGTSDLMERALTRANMLAALKRVRRNKGSAGVDRMTIEDLPEQLKKQWPRIREQLLDGSYEPQPVRRVEIPKANGGKRQLGIPTVIDRLIQQAVLQVLQPVFEPTFSEHSYGFRPGRSAHQAVRKARKYVEAGHHYVVDVDLEKFFDHVDHDVLMGKLAKRVADKRVLSLTRKYLRAGVLVGNTVRRRDEGTPQGGPLSPLLANVMLDELDRMLEKRGRAFIRYADDANVYVANRRVGERVLAQMRKVFKKLKLKVNESKTAVAHVNERKILGYRIYVGKHVSAMIAPSARKRFKDEVRERTKRSHGKSLEQKIAYLAPLIRGWGNYYVPLAPRKQLRELDWWIQRRLRVCVLKNWGNGARAARMLQHLGIWPRKVFFEFSKPKLYKRLWYASGQRVVKLALTQKRFTRKGLPLMAARNLNSTNRLVRSRMPGGVAGARRRT